MTDLKAISITLVVLLIIYFIGWLIKLTVKSKVQIEQEAKEFLKFIDICEMKVKPSETLLQISFLLEPEITISMKYNDIYGKDILSAFTMQHPQDIVTFKSNYGFSLPHDWHFIIIMREFNKFKDYEEGVNNLNGCLRDLFIKQFHYSQRITKDVS